MKEPGELIPRTQLRMEVIENLTELFVDYIRSQDDQWLTIEQRQIETYAAIDDMAIILAAVPLAVCNATLPADSLDYIRRLMDHIHQTATRSIDNTRSLHHLPVGSLIN